MGAKNMGDNLKNGGDKGALGISLLGVVKFQSAPGIDKLCYAIDFENILKIFIFSTAEAIEKQSVGVVKIMVTVQKFWVARGHQASHNFRGLICPGHR